MEDTIAQISSALVPLLGAFAGWATAQLGKSRKADKALTEGVKSLLRGQIIDDGLTYLEEGAIPPFALETMEHQNDAYVRLGDGDKSVNDIVDRCRLLPIRSGHDHEKEEAQWTNRNLPHWAAAWWPSTATKSIRITRSPRMTCTSCGCARPCRTRRRF